MIKLIGGRNCDSCPAFVNRLNLPDLHPFSCKGDAEADDLLHAPALHIHIIAARLNLLRSFFQQNAQIGVIVPIELQLEDEAGQLAVDRLKLDVESPEAALPIGTDVILECTGAAQPRGMESACSGLPEQRSAGCPVVCGTRHQSEDVLQLAEESICCHGRTTAASGGSTPGGQAKVRGTPAAGCPE